MRITAGRFKGRSILTPKGEQTRPTSERLRQTLFDILGPSIENATFLDLFAGSGAMAIEAISRGAKEATLVEYHKLALQAIKHNLQALQIDNATLLSCDAIKALSILKNHVFDIVYIDPPYPSTQKEEIYLHKLLKTLANNAVVKKEGKLFFELPSKLKTFNFSPFEVIESRATGNTTLYRITFPSS